MSKNGPLSLVFNAVVVAFILAPLVVVCWVAFTPYSTLTLPTDSFSLRWFYAIFEHGGFVVAFQNSLWLAVLSASLATALAVPAAIAIARGNFPGKEFLNGVFLSPLMIPNLVLGIAMLRFFSLIGQTGSFSWLMLAHVIVITPYVIRLVLAALVGIDPSIEHAAASLGAARMPTFFRVTLPMVLPGIAGGWLLAFITSFDELAMSIFVTSPSTMTLPVQMYVYATESIDPMMAAISAVVIALTAITMVLLDRIYGLDKVLVGKQ